MKYIWNQTRYLLRVGLSVVAVVLFASALASCGNDNSGSASSPTVTETVTNETPPVDTGASEVDTSSSSSGSGDITVPDVVGKNHQDAQDEMQAAGLYNLSEEDATGKGRLLILDSNWEVVEQDPPAGEKVGSDQTITLKSKKIGE